MLLHLIALLQTLFSQSNRYQTKLAEFQFRDLEKCQARHKSKEDLAAERSHLDHHKVLIKGKVLVHRKELAECLELETMQKIVQLENIME